MVFSPALAHWVLRSGPVHLCPANETEFAVGHLFHDDSTSTGTAMGAQSISVLSIQSAPLIFLLPRQIVCHLRFLCCHEASFSQKTFNKLQIAQGRQCSRLPARTCPGCTPPWWPGSGHQRCPLKARVFFKIWPHWCPCEYRALSDTSMFITAHVLQADFPSILLPLLPPRWTRRD